MRKAFLSTQVTSKVIVFQNETDQEASRFVLAILRTSKLIKEKGKLGLMAFCLIFLSSLSFGQTISTLSGKAPLRIETPKNWKKDKSMYGEAVYTAPSNCRIIDYSIQEIHRNGPVQRSVDHLQAGSRFVSTQEVNSSFSNANDLATSLNIKGADFLALKAKLESKYSQYEKIQSSLEASHATLRLKATVNGNGWGNGRSWFEGALNVKLMCCEDYFCSQEELDKNLNGFVQNYADSLANANSGNPSNSSTQPSIQPLWLYVGVAILIILIIIIIVIRRRRNKR